MNFEEFTEIFDENILPEIKKISEKNPFIKTKNIVVCRREIYDAYEHLNTLYKKQIFNKTEEVLLDRHKVASCICGAFLKVSVFDKTELIKYLKETHQAVDAYVFYVNELIALTAAARFLSYFMVSEKAKIGDNEAACEIIKKFPLFPRPSNCKLGFLGITLYNLSQIKVYELENAMQYSIGLEHYDIYSYAMYFYWLELYFNMILTNA